MKNNRYIVHIDMDAFFAAVEQRDNPAYRFKPVIIGADPKQGKGRGVVSTCSYEARKFGVRSAMPISVAYQKCPQAVFLPVDMEKYNSVSESIIAILRGFSPLVEQVSIDEAFLDISNSYKLYGSAYQACSAMKLKIKEVTGLTASVGLAPTKMAAKIASDLRKPDGLLEVKKDGLFDFLCPLEVERLWGVGEKTRSVLNRAGIRTIGDLSIRSKQELVSLFGKSGIWFWQASRGIDESPVINDRQVKSVSNETTFESDIGDMRKVMTELVRLCELVSDRLRQGGFKCRTITLKLRLEGFITYTRAITLSEPTNFSDDLIREIRKLFEISQPRGKKIRLTGVRASNLSRADEPSLFKGKGEEKREEVHKALDKIKRKFGRGGIFRAAGA